MKYSKDNTTNSIRKPNETSITNPETNILNQEQSNPKKRRRTDEERLEISKAKRKAIDNDINRFQNSINAKNEKIRNRALHLLGEIAENYIKKDLFTIIPTKNLSLDWWLKQTATFSEKDTELYTCYITELRNNELSRLVEKMQKDIAEYEKT